MMEMVYHTSHGFFDICVCMYNVDWNIQRDRTIKLG